MIANELLPILSLIAPPGTIGGGGGGGLVGGGGDPRIVETVPGAQAGNGGLQSPGFP